ncbi:MAG TPA: FMN-binding protein, partial [Victivallales bacterium]|nr:FMN-binding protein [Victivallales bacterium]
SFYEQNETPGLGAEIMKENFRRQFNGKKLSADGKINFKRKGEKLSEHDIEAITGATQTSTRLEKIINNSIKEWLKNISN